MNSKVPDWQQLTLEAVRVKAAGLGPAAYRVERGTMPQ
jgi:hypothetical protein